MKTAKINQLDKINQQIIDINIHLEWLRYNGTEKQIAKVEERESKLCERGYAKARTMTEEEYNESQFGFIQCMSWEEARE